MSIYGIYLQYANKNKESGEDIFRNLLYKITGSVVPVIVVDNQLTKSSKDFRIIKGNNKFREFSGYQVGLEYLRSENRLNDETVLFFANDTFNVNYSGSEYLNLFLHKSSIRSCLRGDFVGYVDRLDQDVAIGEWKGKYWVRTSLFSIGYQNLKKILPFGKGFMIENVFSLKNLEFFSENKTISENYKKFLLRWLFGEETDFPFQDKWHSAKRLNKENKAAFIEKAKCIFSEFILTQNAKAMGVPIWDIRSISK
ncbi:hypothetical protein LPTSP4_02920 [Leptospira ryugenii]|uniref:Glycosyltransferase n=1 Tax=Leptospira ryugenii TaxID=1917863 RepID=A0A2P2DVY4_9LEPT|nr:hypothetical protein [Leptospira ryugenii]GBF48792.1 hypothetical protein LPTSP4_02920 [Leptospira ryugenii]